MDHILCCLLSRADLFAPRVHTKPTNKTGKQIVDDHPRDLHGGHDDGERRGGARVAGGPRRPRRRAAPRQLHRLLLEVLREEHQVAQRRHPSLRVGKSVACASFGNMSISKHSTVTLDMVTFDIWSDLGK